MHSEVLTAADLAVPEEYDQGGQMMRGLLEDNATGGATPVEVSVKHEGDKTHIVFQWQGLSMSLIVGADDFAHACRDLDEGR